MYSSGHSPSKEILQIGEAAERGCQSGQEMDSPSLKKIRYYRAQIIHLGKAKAERCDAICKCFWV